MLDSSSRRLNRAKPNKKASHRRREAFATLEKGPAAATSGNPIYTISVGIFMVTVKLR